MQPLKLRKLRVEALILVEVSDSFERVRAMWHKLSQIGKMSSVNMRQLLQIACAWLPLWNSELKPKDCQHPA